MTDLDNTEFINFTLSKTFPAINFSIDPVVTHAIEDNDQFITKPSMLLKPTETLSLFPTGKKQISDVVYSLPSGDIAIFEMQQK
ncbi:MAG: hypothetical protein LBF22_02710 [Deltaproteobacteria bacterium]|jgi:hypothetical protein|nr:hypothetical protein [Deltaproteobacteria bacterium]